jgi:inner membrane transporter RhtA
MLLKAFPQPMSAPTTSLSSQPTTGALHVVPSWLLVVLAIISVQLGAVFAKDLFPAAGTFGVVFLRTFLGGIIFLAIFRPQVWGHGRRVYAYVLLYAFCIAANMLIFYAAIDRIPLGITVAIAFIGPLAVSVAGSRRAIDLLWVALAAVGIILLSPITDTTLDPVGIGLAFACAAAWGGIIVVARRAGSLLPGNTMLALAMCAAAVMTAPFGAAASVGVLASPALIGMTLVVAVLSSVIPFWFEFAALQRLSARVVGLLLSLEPATGALLGWVLLSEGLNIEKIVGIALVSVAAAATTRNG